MNIQSISTSLPPSAGLEAGAALRDTRAATVPTQKEAPPEKSTQSVSAEALEAAVNSVRDYIKPINSDLQFSVNDDTDKVVVTVVDSETKEVIRQIPSEEMLAIAKALDNIKGLFIKQQA